MRKLLLLSSFAFLLTLTSCIEGVELEENPRYRIPDDRQTLIVYSTFYRFTSSNNMSEQDSIRYRDSLITIFGDTRTILFVNADSGQEFEVEVPTVVPNQTGAVGCEGEGVPLLLTYGERYDIYDTELSSTPDFLRTEFIDNYDFCAIYRVPYP